MNDKLKNEFFEMIAGISIKEIEQKFDKLIEKDKIVNPQLTDEERNRFCLLRLKRIYEEDIKTKLKT